MVDDLQQAYSAYQQALYHMRDPKVGCSVAVAMGKANVGRSRSQSFGTGSESCMTGMAHLNMPRRRSRKSCAWRQILKRPMRYTSDLA
jgi:hypothetical protein